MSDDDRAAKAARAKALVRLSHFEVLHLTFASLSAQQKEAAKETWPCFYPRPWRGYVNDTDTRLAISQGTFPSPRGPLRRCEGRRDGDVGVKRLITRGFRLTEGMYQSDWAQIRLDRMRRNRNG